MQTVKALRAGAQTFLTHVFGRGLDDERYTVERFRTTVDGEIQARPGETRKAVSLRTVRRLRPERNEIVVCTGASIDGGVQYWGTYAVWGHMLRQR